LTLTFDFLCQTYQYVWVPLYTINTMLTICSAVISRSQEHCERQTDGQIENTIYPTTVCSRGRHYEHI